jgi:hypothetical protein
LAGILAGDKPFLMVTAMVAKWGNYGDMVCRIKINLLTIKALMVSG